MKPKQNTKVRLIKVREEYKPPGIFALGEWDWSDEDFLDKVFNFMTVDQLSDRVPQILIDGILREGEIAIFGGGTKTAKTLLLQCLAICATNGLPFLGRAVKQCYRVPILDFELQENTIKRRLEHMCALLQAMHPNKQITADRIPIVSLEELPSTFVM
jgi:hypothetical protein